MGAGAEYQFIAWARVGVGALLGGAPATVHVQLGGAGEVSRTLSPHGPGDVVALDPRAVLRTVPGASATDFEPNLFPSVELAHPALPWMLSPPPDSHGRVTPWIVLVVVEEGPGVTLTAGTAGQILTIDAPASVADQLPDLTQAWAWAHGQTTGEPGAAITGAPFAAAGGAARSRLLAARRLAPGKGYVACVVPAFAAGVAAALGEPPRTGLAWQPSDTHVRLPVYFCWRFGTGPGGDFASLARLIQPGALADDVGRRMIDISAPGWGMPELSGAQLQVSGALRATATPPATSAAAGAIGDAIVQQLAGPADVLPPPCYGAAATRHPDPASGPSWQRALNHDVAQRVAAGLGAQVVRANLDTLVDAAWRVAGDAARANEAIRHAELAAEISHGLARKHVGAIADDGEALAVARPLFARMQGRTLPLARAQAVAAGDAPAGPTLAAMIAASAMPNALMSAGLRRLGRAHGPIARTAPAMPIRTGALVAAVNAQHVVAVPARALATGAAGFDAVSQDGHERPRFHLATSDAVIAAGGQWMAELRAAERHPAARARVIAAQIRVPEVPGEEIPWTPIPISRDPHPAPAVVDEFVGAASAHQHYIVGRLEAVSDRAFPPLGSRGVARPLAAIRASVEAQWTPAAGIVPLLGSRLIGATASTAFAPVKVAPVLEAPLVSALQALSPEHVMPGVSGVVANRAAVVLTAPEVVRALLVGANEELGRELLWRGFPGALGHTWLRTFWGRTVIGADGAPVRLPDIPAIETWPDAGIAPAPATLVLVLRADVLHRYPNALVYAQAARWDGKRRIVGASAPLAPVIATTLAGDIALFGFDLDETTARGGDVPGGPAGWYFVIAEHPSEPRFGLAASSHAPLAGWRDVAWSDVTAGDLAGNYLRTDGPLAARSFAGDALRWASDAAAQAAITRRRAVRVALHASTLLPRRAT